MEWMNGLFEGETQVFTPGDDSIRGFRKASTVGKRHRDIAGAINELDVQVLVVVEGSNRPEELQLFFDQLIVEGNWECAVQ